MRLRCVEAAAAQRRRAAAAAAAAANLDAHVRRVDDVDEKRPPPGEPNARRSPPLPRFGRGDEAAAGDARSLGVAHVDEIVQAYAAERGGDTALYRRYLTKHIHFSLGESEVEGLRLFYAKACQHDLIESVPSLTFFS